MSILTLGGHTLDFKQFLAITLLKRPDKERILMRDVFYVRRNVDLMKMAKVNTYIMYIFGKIELLSIHAI